VSSFGSCFPRISLLYVTPFNPSSSCYSHCARVRCYPTASVQSLRRSFARQTLPHAALLSASAVALYDSLPPPPPLPLAPLAPTAPVPCYPPSIRAKFEKVIREAQDSICAAISEIDGTPFHQDAWTREDGGGGITRVLNVSLRCYVLGWAVSGQETVLCCAVL
jgi:hypothetical protein